VLDLSAVQYLDSAGIAALDSLRRATELRLVVDPSSIIHRGLVITGFDQLIPVYDSVPPP
jgi:anti-anti-sigma factor